MASNAELPIKEENIDDADFESSDLPEYDNKNEPFDSELEGDSQNLWLKNGRLPTLSSHFFANYMNIFHKTEVQTIIFRCWPGLYLNWYKSYEKNTQIFPSPVFFSIL